MIVIRMVTVLVFLVIQHAYATVSTTWRPQDRCARNTVTWVSCSNVTSPDNLMPHPDDCQLFYYCIHQYLPAICRQCPANLHFNPVSHVCDWPSQAGCHIQTTTAETWPSTTGTPEPSTETTETWTTTTEPSTETTEQWTETTVPWPETTEPSTETTVPWTERTEPWTDTTSSQMPTESTSSTMKPTWSTDYDYSSPTTESTTPRDLSTYFINGSWVLA